MNTDTSRKPVKDQFSLKALILAGKHTGKTIPVENQLKTSNEKYGKTSKTSYPLTGITVSVTGSGKKRTFRHEDEGSFMDECQKAERQDQAINSSLPVDPLDLPDSDEAIAWATHVWGLADHDVNIHALLIWDVWLRLKDEQLVIEPMGRLRPDELAVVRRWLKLRDSRGVTREAHIVQTLQTGIPWQGDDLPMTPPFEMKQARRFFDTLKDAA
uniref:Uncharacterized protein n=1 Tax=uncultured prokaryote TaxID=198431 RepID=A0A0H5Q0B1_9ZZZZ|nr:hypothetical protein [uncultured prokaryote]